MLLLQRENYALLLGKKGKNRDLEPAVFDQFLKIILMMKWHICNSAFLSPSPEFCEPFWWITEPKRRDCGNAQIST